MQKNWLTKNRKFKRTINNLIIPTQTPILLMIFIQFSIEISLFFFKQIFFLLLFIFIMPQKKDIQFENPWYLASLYLFDSFYSLITWFNLLLLFFFLFIYIIFLSPLFFSSSSSSLYILSIFTFVIIYKIFL